MSTLIKKFHKVMQDCSYIQKDQQNSFHKYKYASASAVFAKVNEALSKHGLASVAQSEILSTSDTTTKDKSGNEKIDRFVTVKATITILDTEGDGTQTLTISGLGSGLDSGDKAIAKAQTMAIKYAWVGALNISTGDDPEADDELDERVSPIQKYIDLLQHAKNAEEIEHIKTSIRNNGWKSYSIGEKERFVQAGESAKKRLGI